MQTTFKGIKETEQRKRSLAATHTKLNNSSNWSEIDMQIDFIDVFV